jgi:hypothetical protein
MEIQMQKDTKTQYTKEYRTLLEKLLEIHIRIDEVKGDRKIQQKIEPVIDMLVKYFTFNISRTLVIQKKYQESMDKYGFQEDPRQRDRD